MASRGMVATREPDDKPLDYVVFRSDLVTVGAFRAHVGHPRFRDSGPIQNPVFVFPRTAVVIRHEGCAPFVTDTRTVTFYNAGQRYTRAPADPRGDRCEWYSVREDVLIDVLTRSDQSVAERPERPFAWSHVASDARSYVLQRLVFHHVQRSDALDRLAVEATVLTLLSRLAELASARTRSRPARSADDDGAHSQVAAVACDVLRREFSRSLSLDHVARAAGVSPFHLCRVFRREVGTTIHRYRHELRLRESLERLTEPARDLTRVALGLGFSSHSHFSAAFRQAFAMSPSEFRRRACRRTIADLAQSLASGAPH